MDNIKYLPLGLFFAYAGKLMIVGPTFVDAASLLVLGGVAVFYEYKSNSKKIKELQAKLDAVSTRQDEKDKEISELRSFMSAAKMAQSFKRNA